MEPDKTPGTNGLPADFYKLFWNDISDYLVNSINYAFGKGQLSVTQRWEIIKLIPKKDAEPSSKGRLSEQEPIRAQQNIT